MCSRKKWRIVYISILFSFALSSKAYASEELLDNDLNLNVERLERGQTTTNRDISNNEELFSEKANEKIKEYIEKEKAEQVEQKESFFTQGTIKTAAYDTTITFREQSANEYIRIGEYSAGMDNSFDTGVLIAALSVFTVIIMGSAASYRLFKRG